ncbi:MAG: hypothetical protein E6Q93_28720 [Burkholderiaceae bacterium]|nr:MAG: hypothetical protein E6Q93_28720 [Burkholderiaceae bacterium]
MDLRSTRRAVGLTPLALSLMTAFPLAAPAATPECLATGQCSGDQSGGIDVSAPPVMLNVFSLSGSGIRPPASHPGIRLTSQAGSSLSVFSGVAGAPISVSTDGAPGIQVNSQGRPSGSGNDPFLQIPIPPLPGLQPPPGSQPAAGGAVMVRNHGDITTSGSGAHGIVAESSTLGYGTEVVGQLQAFDAGRFSFAVTSVAGQPVSFGTPVPTPLATITQLPSGQWVFGNQFGAAHGSATFRADGTVDLGLDTAYFDTALVAGQRQVVAVPIVLIGTRDDGVTQPGVQGWLMVAYSKDAHGVLSVSSSTYFPSYGQSLLVAGTRQLPWPDLADYALRLRNAAQQSGGSGGNVTVEHLSGMILTQGPGAHGVVARSIGQGGGNGDDGGGFWTFGLDWPDAGAAGSGAGQVNVRVDGNIHTSFQPTTTVADAARAQASVGVLAVSAGGQGGNGGYGGTYYDGAAGGAGGNGGEVHVTGRGTIVTEGRYGIGLYALSTGGNGGNGGGAEFVTDGGQGGAGGHGNLVVVDGAWNVQTKGDEAHGIWAKSAAGTAGSGGSGGWAAGAPASGGRADDGGEVRLTSAGQITTEGDQAIALFGQSVGGFGGSGGGGFSLFYSRGGSGSSAGSGGKVTVTNDTGGMLHTSGTASHGLMAQSVGGGGGVGGSTSGIVALGGQGAEGGNGGEVIAVNRGSIVTEGQDARGIYA